MTRQFDRVPTSVLFEATLTDAPAHAVTLAWILARLHRRSFGMVMLFLGLIAMLPGVSVLAAAMLIVLGYQMVLAHESLVLPRRIAFRPLPTQRIAWFIKRSIPLMRALETLIRPRWQTPFTTTKRFVGVVVLLLAVTLFTPIPFSNVIPGLLVMLIAFAYLEEDGVFLCLALFASAGSIAITATEIWATWRGADFLLHS